MNIESLIYLAVMTIAFPFAMYFTIRLTFHMYKIVMNVTGKYASFYGPFILAMPKQFNDEGNLHRIKFLKLIPWLALSYVVCFGVLYILESKGVAWRG